MASSKAGRKSATAEPPADQGPDQEQQGIHPITPSLDATIAAVNNFGSADGHIPARPFLEPAITKGAPQYQRLAEIMIPKVLSGSMAMTTVLEQMGNLAEGHVKQEITDLDTPPNAQSTIDRKGSSSPLIDTGALRQSIRYVIDESTEPLEEGL